MLWYLLKTWEGKEEELVQEIHRAVPSNLYEEVFIIRTERIWRRKGHSIIHMEPMFKGCVFLTCRETQPVFRYLERTSSLGKWIMTGYLTIYPLMAKDAGFLQQLSGDDHVARTSCLLRQDDTFRSGDDGRPYTFYRVSGPLAHCLGDIEDIEFRKRFVKLHRRLWGEETTIALGVLLSEDLAQGAAEEEPEAATEQLDSWATLRIMKNADGRHMYIAETCAGPAAAPFAVLPETYEKIAQGG